MPNGVHSSSGQGCLAQAFCSLFKFLELRRRIFV
jgi:hypothetical protein